MIDSKLAEHINKDFALKSDFRKKNIPTYLYDFLPDVLIIKDQNHQFVYANKAAVNLFGGSVNAFFEMEEIGLFTEASQGELQKEELQVLESKCESRIASITFQNEKLKNIPSRVELFPILIPGGEVFIGEKIILSPLISERSEYSKSLYSGFDWSPLIENSLVGVGVFDINQKRFLDANQRILDYFKCSSKEEFLKSSPQDYHPEFQPTGQLSKDLFRDIVRSMVKGENKTFEVMHQISNGVNTYTEITGFQVSPENPNICFLLFKEITDRIKAKQALENNLNFFQKIIDNIECPIFAKNLNLEYTMCNKAFAVACEKDKKEIIGKTYKEVCKETWSFSEEEEDRALLEHKGRFNYEGKYKDEKGEERNFLIQRRTFNNENEEVEGIAGVIFDLTPIMKTKEELVRKNKELQKYIDSNSQLENFAYFASHDLKEPLRTIGNFTQLIEKRYSENFDNVGKEFMKFIIDGVSNMNRLIDDMLTYSKVDRVEDGRTVLRFSDLLEGVVMNVQQSLSENNGTFQMTGVPEEVYGDRTKLIQLFQNLISNAIKFKRPGFDPKIALECEEEEGFWKFRLMDNGIGIPKESQDKIFELFKKLHSKQEYEGTGIGLALCHKIVEQHEGEIWVESEFGKGTTFSFTLKRPS